MPVPLRLRVGAKNGEDVLGLAQRLAQRSGYVKFAPFLRDYKISLDVASFDTGISRVAQLSGLASAPLREWSWKPISPSVLMFRSQNFPMQSGVVGKYRRYCPHCLQDDFENADTGEPQASMPFIRSWWRTALIYACPTHSVAMLNNCPKCNERISDHLLPLHQCSCGYDLRGSKSVQLSPNDLIANKYFLGRLSMGEASASPMLDRISLAEVAIVLRRLGAAAVLGKRDEIKVAVGQLDKDLACDQEPVAFGRLLNTGFEYARDGSSSLSKLLEKMIDGRSPPFAGPEQIVGEKFRSWAVHRDNPIRESLRQIWDPFILNHCLPTRRTSQIDKYRPDHLSGRPQLLHSLEKQRFARALGFALPDHMSRKDAYRLGTSKGLLVTKEPLLDYLGRGSNLRMRLDLEELLVPAWYSDVSHVQPYYVRDAEIFSNHLSELSLGEPNTKAVTLLSAILKCKVKGAPILFSRIFRRDIPLFKSACGSILESFSIPLDLSPKHEIESVDKSDAALLIGVDIATIELLIAHGHLHKADGEDSALLKLQPIFNLIKSFVTATKLGSICSSDMQPEEIDKLLMDAGVRSALPHSCQMIFPKAEAIRAFYRNWHWGLEPIREDVESLLATQVA